MYATLVWNITADFLVNVGYWIVSLFLFPFIEKENQECSWPAQLPWKMAGKWCICVGDCVVKFAAEVLSERSGVRDDDSHLLTELVDGLILLYNMSAHKQLGKVPAFCDA